MLELVSTGLGDCLDKGNNRDSNMIQNISNWLTERKVISLQQMDRRAAFRKEILYAG